MVMVLLGFKPFTNRTEITSLPAKDLRDEFFQFKDSIKCPDFVRKAFNKENVKKADAQQQNSSQDDIERDALQNNAESDDEFEGFEKEPLLNNETRSDTRRPVLIEKQANEPQNMPGASQEGPPPVAKFTEAYQEYGHMAPKAALFNGCNPGSNT